MFAENANKLWIPNMISSGGKLFPRPSLVDRARESSPAWEVCSFARVRGFALERPPFNYSSKARERERDPFLSSPYGRELADKNGLQIDLYVITWWNSPLLYFGLTLRITCA